MNLERLQLAEGDCLCFEEQAAKREAGRLEKECQQIVCIVSALKNHVTDVEHQIDEAVREVSADVISEALSVGNCFHSTHFHGG